jgi:hypothetical protein
VTVGVKKALPWVLSLLFSATALWLLGQSGFHQDQALVNRIEYEKAAARSQILETEAQTLRSELVILRSKYAALESKYAALESKYSKATNELRLMMESAMKGEKTNSAPTTNVGRIPKKGTAPN